MKTAREVRDALRVGMCVNGCEKPIQPPSKVICKDCTDRITRALERAAGVTPTGAETDRKEG